MADMAAIVCGRLYQCFPGCAVFQHSEQLDDQKAEACGGTPGINDCQIKIRIFFQDTVPCNIGGVEGACDSCGKAQIDNAVTIFCIGHKGFFKHGRVDVIGSHISACIIQYFVKFPGLNGFPIQIIHFVNNDGCGDDMQLISADQFLR